MADLELRAVSSLQVPAGISTLPLWQSLSDSLVSGTFDTSNYGCTSP